MASSDKRLKWYFIIAFVPAWILQIIGSVCLVNKTGGETAAQGIFTVCMAVCMYFPFLATLLSAKLTGEKTGIKLRPNFKGHIRWYAAAWFLPAVFFGLGDLLYYTVLRDNFDKDLTLIYQSIEMSGNTEGLTPTVVILSMVLSAVTAVPVLNGIAAFGEETGWRGYMTPVLTEKLGRTKGLLLSGIIWAIWHFPVIAVAGYDFGTGYPLYPIPGLLAMCLACTAIGIALSFIYEKSGSILVPSIAHGAINGAISLGILFLRPEVTSMVLGPKLGVLNMIPLAAVSAVILFRSKAPEQ